MLKQLCVRSVAQEYIHRLRTQIVEHFSSLRNDMCDYSVILLRYVIIAATLGNLVHKR